MTELDTLNVALADIAEIGQRAPALLESILTPTRIIEIGINANGVPIEKIIELTTGDVNGLKSDYIGVLNEMIQRINGVKNLMN